MQADEKLTLIDLLGPARRQGVCQACHAALMVLHCIFTYWVVALVSLEQLPENELAQCAWVRTYELHFPANQVLIIPFNFLHNIRNLRVIYLYFFTTLFIENSGKLAS